MLSYKKAQKELLDKDLKLRKSTQLFDALSSYLIKNTQIHYLKQIEKRMNLKKVKYKITFTLLFHFLSAIVTIIASIKIITKWFFWCLVSPASVLTDHQVAKVNSAQKEVRYTQQTKEDNAEARKDYDDCVHRVRRS